ncbi:hypothetical protein BV25DRAFT_1857368 [Artomyces pyxidatus]|uniref:Uncharacterized protein n=1 Tax=Artomyces pyxidatus TaxID=48021 RepID=A0ACB8SZ48_9AGAM|nr:hypothetical protein BV25DRAFT_1857368 [Artomyces pyxidatus]
MSQINDDNPKIPLEPNSLYIATSQLVMGDPGTFHWSFYLTDSAGVATKHHWAEIQSRDPTSYAEGYISTVVEPVTTYSKNFQATFAYCKVNGFTFPGQAAFKAVASQAFPEDRRLGFPTMRANRAAGLTCRTWVMAILGHLQTLGYLQRVETAEWFEAKVKEISVSIETGVAASGGLQKSLICEI